MKNTYTFTLALIWWCMLSSSSSQAQTDKYKLIEDIFPIEKPLSTSKKRTFNRSSNPKLPIGNNLTESNVFKLESKTNAPNLIYLDFNGEDVTKWKFSGIYVVDSSDVSHDQIRTIWEVAAADFLTFDVNVTTNRALFDSWPTAKKIMCVLGESFALSKKGGVAYLNTFGKDIGCLVNLKINKSFYSAHIVGHELGHALGLTHDGISWPGPVTEYYGGHADWGPIMGAGFGEYRTWSKGEYDHASKKQDDIAIIAQHLSYRKESYPGIHEIVTDENNNIPWQSNFGIIENSADVDTFFFNLVDSGRVKLEIGTAVKHTNLDVEMEVLTSNWQSIHSSNLPLNRGADFDSTLNAGKYYILIKSGFEKTPTTGFSNYSSFGYFEISGEINNVSKPNIDIAVNSINGFNSNCGDKLEGSISVSNTGNDTINNGEINVYANGNWIKSFSLNGPISPGEVITTPLFDFTAYGSGNIEAIVTIDSTQTESIQINNSLSTQYQIAKGKQYLIETDVSNYSNHQNFTWDILLNNSAKINGNLVDIEKNGAFSEQNFCLEDDCFELKITGDWQLCSSFNPHQIGTTYNANDIVVKDSIVYKAKWWNSSTPPSSAWEKTDECYLSNYSINLVDVGVNNNILSYTSNSNSLAIEDSFCLGTITNINPIHNFELSLFPNPFKEEIKLSSNKSITRLEVVNLSGKVIYIETSPFRSLKINSIDWPHGLYFINVWTDESRKVVKVVK